MQARQTIRLGAFLSIGAFLLTGCGVDEPADDEPGIAYSTPDEPRHVLVKPPRERLHELFPEGGGLIRRVAPDLAGEPGWWLAYLTPAELLALEKEGVEWLEDGPTLLATGGSMASECPNSPGSNEFCPYAASIPRCNESILQEISNAPSQYPPVFGKNYVEVLDLGMSDQGHFPIRALRIGKLWQSGEPPVPQLVVYAAQHAREWVTSEFAMRLIRYYAGSYRDGTNGVRSLLADRAIVVLPVSNPEGYEYTHTGTTERMWRPNRTPCSGGVGTDPNRNFPFSWDRTGAGDACLNNENSTYRGASAGIAASTGAVVNLLANKGLPGSYVTRFALNTHSYGNAVIFPEGLSAGFGPCDTNSNCSAPDLGVFHELVGTSVTPWMLDEEINSPYVTGQTYRALYAVSGDSVTEHVYGALPDGAPPLLGAGIELTNTECTFHAERIPDGEFDVLFDRFEGFTTHLLEELPALHDGSFFSTYQLPHVHRRSPDAGLGLAEFPMLRVGVRKAHGSVSFPIGGGTGLADDVLAGVEYKMWRWEPDVPYMFPTVIPVCANGVNCEAARLADPGSGMVNLCDPNLFSVFNGFSFVGDLPGGPQDECHFRFDASGGGPPWELTSNWWSLANMEEARLVFSVRWHDRAVTSARVVVSNNGFSGCTATGYGTCRIVRSYPFGPGAIDLRSTDFRTEIIDVSDFDGTAVQVRFEVLSANTGRPQPWFDVYDVAVVGWSK